MQKMLETGTYASESELLDVAMSGFAIALKENESSAAELPKWFLDEAVAAANELDVHPERALSSQQVDEYLSQQRALRSNVDHAVLA